MMAGSARFMLAPLSILYDAVMRTRLSLYRIGGGLMVHRISQPVISVGNITTGGTGKTPLVEWITQAIFRDGERRMCVLSRGYGRAAPQRRVLVSDGVRLLAEWRESGDEPWLLAERLRGVAAVVSDANRVAAARWAEQHLQSQVFILDDGFQHLAIERDLDIVTIDATDPWGGGYVLPRGRLREHRRNLARADCIVVTRADLLLDLDSLLTEVHRWSNGRAPVLIARTRLLHPQPLGASATDTPLLHRPSLQDELFTRQPAAAFCAIGNAEAFFTQLSREGHTLNYTRAFPDHHHFTQKEIDEVTLEAVHRGARSLLVTAKDAVKLRSFCFALPCYVVEMRIELDDEKPLLELLRKAIQRKVHAVQVSS